MSAGPLARIDDRGRPARMDHRLLFCRQDACDHQCGLEVRAHQANSRPSNT